MIRMPMEAVFRQFHDVNLIRINRDNSDGPDGTLSISATADRALAQIREQLIDSDNHA